MTVFDPSNQSVMCINFREKAPLNAAVDMFHGNTNLSKYVSKIDSIITRHHYDVIGWLGCWYPGRSGRNEIGSRFIWKVVYCDDVIIC